MITKEELEKMLEGKLRCPFCNINDAPPIDEEEWETEYFEGFRHYCACCDKVFFEPVVDFNDVLHLVSQFSKEVQNGKR